MHRKFLHGWLSITPSTSTLCLSDHRENYKSCALLFYSHHVQTSPKSLQYDLQDRRDFITGLIKYSSEETGLSSLCPLIESRGPKVLLIYYFYHLRCLFTGCLWYLRFGWLLIFGLYKEFFLYKSLNMYPFD